MKSSIKIKMENQNCIDQCQFGINESDDSDNLLNALSVCSTEIIRFVLSVH
jgi:hypothetical protein